MSTTELQNKETCETSTCDNKQVPQQNQRVRLRPRVDILEHSDHFLMLVDLPGVSKEDLEVTLEKDELQIHGLAKSAMPEGYQFVAGNRYDRSFERTFRISDEIDRDGIEVELKNGVAHFRLPKSVKAQKVKLAIN